MSCTARDPVFPGIILSRSCLFMISRETFAGGKYVLDTLITGGMRVLQSFCTGSFKLFRTVPVRELQESHTRPVSLLFHPAGGKYAVYDPIGCCTDRFRPLAEAVPVPFKILLVALGHMLRDRRILPRASIESFVGCDPAEILEISIVVSVSRTSTLSLIY